MEEKNQNQEFSFIKEKIKDKPINRRRLLYQILWTVLVGILFGFTACITFVAARPKLEKFMEIETDAKVTIPRDEEFQEQQTGPDVKNDTEHIQENQTDTGEQQVVQNSAVSQEEQQNGNLEQSDSNGQNQNSQKSEQSSETIEHVYVEKELDIEEFQNLQNKLFLVGKKANRSVVTVTGVKNHIDWFESSYESETQASGIIIANNGQELLILTEKKIVDNAEEIHITFINDVIVSASVKKYDANTGIAIISVPLEDVSEETRKQIDVATLGNSFMVNQGSVVLAIGSPLGANYSILIGSITSSNNTISMWDSIYNVFTTDIMGSTNGSGVLINLKGEVVGLVMQDYSSQSDRNTITALSISQLKGIIEDLSNGKAIPYLGLKLSTITEEIAEEYNLPKGVYIKNVETDVPSPAMNAGIQAGDVLVGINGEKILTVEQYFAKIMSLSPEQSVKIKVLRQSGEEYIELECDAVVGVLQ